MNEIILTSNLSEITQKKSSDEIGKSNVSD